MEIGLGVKLFGRVQLFSYPYLVGRMFRFVCLFVCLFIRSITQKRMVPKCLNLV